MSDQVHTIADAARALGIGERRLRRLLARPEYAARTLTVERLTRTGTRQAVTVPAELFEEIRQRIEIEENAANADGGSDTDKRGQAPEAGPQRGGTLTRTEGMLAQLYAEEKRRNERLEARIDELVAITKSQAQTIATLTANAADSESVSVQTEPVDLPQQASQVPRSETLAANASKSASEPDAAKKPQWFDRLVGIFVHRE